MSDNKKKEDGRDDNKIDSHDASEVAYAAKEFGVTQKEVRDLIVNPGLSSSQLKGIETVAPGFGRKEYGPAIAAPALFCIKSKYIFPLRLDIILSKLVNSGTC